eukprot:9862449-Alexandrium_andersonii.AAC.1
MGGDASGQASWQEALARWRIRGRASCCAGVAAPGEATPSCSSNAAAIALAVSISSEPGRRSRRF